MQKIFVIIIEFYRKHISPYTPPCCKFVPTCSEYALQAFEKHGFFKGLLLSAWRILRCNPFSKGGYDPVPEKMSVCSKEKNERVKTKIVQNKESISARWET